MFVNANVQTEIKNSVLCMHTYLCITNYIHMNTCYTIYTNLACIVYYSDLGPTVNFISVAVFAAGVCVQYIM